MRSLGLWIGSYFRSGFRFGGCDGRGFGSDGLGGCRRLWVGLRGSRYYGLLLDLLALLLAADNQAAAKVFACVVLFGLSNDTIGFELRLNLENLKIVQGGHVALDLGKSHVFELGGKVLAGHAVFLG